MAGQFLTVLMTVYNGGAYLQQSVKSVLDQKYSDFEFLIIDDCSTDNSIEVIESFDDARVRIHRNTVNLGQTKSLNVGFKMALGEYVARIDADDVAFPFWLEKQVESVKAYPDHSVVSTYATVINEHNQVNKMYKPAVMMDDLILRSFIASPINHVGSILKRVDALESGGYDQKYKTAADYDLWGKLLRSGKKITTTRQFLVAIREHEQSLSRLMRGKSELTEMIDISKKNISAFSDVTLNDEQVEKICQLNYLPESLTIEEFDAAIETVQAIYGSLIPSLGIDADKAIQWGRQQIRTFYVKRIFSFIEQGDYLQVRQTANKGVKNFGFGSIFMLFVLLSLLGQIALSPLPKIYKMTLRNKTRLQLAANH